MAKPQMKKKDKQKLRSKEWFGPSDEKMGFVHRAWMRNQGYPDDHFRGRPVIGICNTWSELTPCNGHLRDLAEFVKRGVLEAGGFPLEFPVTSMGETLMRPTAMLFRNLASMDTEECIRANPLGTQCREEDNDCPSFLVRHGYTPRSSPPSECIRKLFSYTLSWPFDHPPQAVPRH